MREEEGKKRNWAWIAHGKNNSVRLGTMTHEDERVYLIRYLQEVLTYISQQKDVWLTTSDEIAAWYLNVEAEA